MTEVISEGSPVYLRDQSGNSRLINKLVPHTEYRVGRIKIKGVHLINRPYGATISESTSSGVWTRVQPTVIGDEDVEDASSVPGDASDEPSTTGPLSCLVPEASLSSALASSTFSDKTKFSQEKYLRKKHGKYGRELTLLLPTIKLLSDGGNFRWEALSLVARHAAVSSASTCLVFEADTGGLVAAHFQQLGANVLRVAGPKGANSAKAAEALGLVPSAAVRLSSDSALSAELDAVVAVDACNPGSGDSEFAQVLDFGLAHLSAAGGRFVAYVKDIDRALEVQKKLRTEGNFVNVTMQEIFFREHQVLDQRTHPVMTAVIKLFEGFVIAGLRIRKFQ